ncbi:hypothetical protein GGI20_000740 [Coemansia sp. BCRC 34301]|nr:hypothetical protein GGI20_000740 [Coemansia sp. BCRC 34301]
MSDSGYFYADAFKLTRPSACGIKGLSCVNAIDTDTLLPEISIALIKANAGYSPTIKEPVKAPARFGVIPSQALQREIFPWIRPLMCAILQQGNNNSEVLVATRFMRMLKKLRMVLLQDIAFLMEVPLLTGSFQTHRTFENKIFTSEGFLAYRAEMRNALSNTEIREMESYCISTQRWVKGRKQALPRGDQQRLKPTIERLLQPDFVPPPFSNNIVAANMVLPSPTLPNGAPSLGPAPSSTGYPEGNMGLKRTHGEPHSQSPGALHSIEYRADSSAPMLITKRARHGPELAKVAMQMHPDEGAVDMSEAEAKEVVVTEEQPLARVMATIDELRMENDDLRYQMRRIESTLAQQRNEVRSWMGKVEMAIQGRLQASARPRSVSPDNESAGQYYPGAAARAGQPHLTPVHSRQPAYQSQASSQQQMYHARQQVRPPPQLPSQQAQRAYADGRYQQQAVGPAVAHRQASDMVAMHEGGMYGGNGIGSAEAHAAAARRHFTLNRHKSGMQQQAQMAHMGGHPGAAAQMQHVSYSRHGQAQAPSDYSPRRAYADPHVSPQTHYPPAHVNGPERADVSWHNGSQHPSAYSSRRASPGPRDGF